jgi:hypothetical protein
MCNLIPQILQKFQIFLPKANALFLLSEALSVSHLELVGPLKM